MSAAWSDYSIYSNSNYCYVNGILTYCKTLGRQQWQNLMLQKNIKVITYKNKNSGTKWDYRVVKNVYILRTSMTKFCLFCWTWVLDVLRKNNTFHKSFCREKWFVLTYSHMLFVRKQCDYSKKLKCTYVRYCTYMHIL